MTSKKEIDQQLKRLGLSFNYWGRNEIKQLRTALTEDENIQLCINGHYLGGFAMLVATDQRLLLIDSKPMFLTIEAIWYDKIGQIDFHHRLLSATICISTPNKELDFTTWNGKHLHDLLLYSQSKMAEAKGNEQALNEKFSDALDNNDSRAPVPAIAALSPQPNPAPSLSVDNNATITEQEPQPVAQTQPHFHIPAMPSHYDLTLYTATHLPFSRRRYYARSTPS